MWPSSSQKPLKPHLWRHPRLARVVSCTPTSSGAGSSIRIMADGTTTCVEARWLGRVAMVGIGRQCRRLCDLGRGVDANGVLFGTRRQHDFGGGSPSPSQMQQRLRDRARDDTWELEWLSRRATAARRLNEGDGP
ncbi:hypothetical protein ABZP36_017077 [Zizania latifolia]